MNINIRKAAENDIEIMTLIYNDSIKIFPPDQSAEGTKEIFAKTYNNYKTNKKYEPEFNFLKSVKIDRWEILMFRKIPKFVLINL